MAYQKIMALPSEHLCIRDSETGQVDVWGPREHVEARMDEKLRLLRTGGEVYKAGHLVDYDGEWIDLEAPVIPLGKHRVILSIDL